MKVRFAVAAAGRFIPGDYADFLDTLEQRGFDTVWLSDVLLSPGIEPTIGLAYAAACTHRIKLGANVVPLGRNPLLLAKQLAQIDQLSAGRLLLALVPGIGDPAERAALGVEGRDRGGELEETMGLLRRFWSGEAVEHHSERFHFPAVAASPRPAQDPLELWLGGHGPLALERAGRLADGWLGSALIPSEAGAARRRVEQAAARAGRVIDPEHFGLSIPYARVEAPAEQLALLAARRPDLDPASLLPVGAPQLRALIGGLVDEGLSKFVLRPTAAGPAGDDLGWLAEAVLDLQS